MRLDDIEAEELDETTDKKGFRLPDIGKLDKDKLFIIEGAVGIVLLVILIVIAASLIFKKEAKKTDLHEGQIAEAIYEESQEEIAEETLSLEADNEEAAADEAVRSNVDKADVTELSKATPVKGELAQIYTQGDMLTYTKDSYQLPELYAYWDDYQLEAVGDLIRLERVRTITDALGKSNDFYYYGSTNSSGQPDGKGLAVYAYNTYYFGDWSDGKREGTGMWIRIFPDENGVVNGVKGVKEHQYNGSWANDLPNGPGQEHVDYDNSKIDKEFVITNAIGEFRDGYYHGDMYMMTIDSTGRTTDWYGSSEKGSFVFLSDKKTNLGKRSIWKVGEGYATDEEDGCRWIYPKDNVNFGVAGLKK